jgi:hypothetical protein
MSMGQRSIAVWRPAALALVMLAAAAADGRAAAPGRCTRLPLSDIQVGREATIAAAREKLGDYAAKVAKQRGWGAVKKSAETVSCEDYLYLPVIGQEYKCLVTATFCAQ